MSSSRPEHGFARFLTQSLALLKAELPDVHRALCARLAPRVVRVCIDGDAVALVFSADDVGRAIDQGPPHVDIESDREAILAVVDAETTLADAVLCDRLRLRGACDDILAFHDGFLLYVHGAVRAPSFPALLREFRRSTELN